MSQSPSALARFSITDERARATVQMFSQTVMAAVVWVVSWKVVAPMIGVRVLAPGEFFQAMSSVAAALTFSGVEPSRSLVEIMAGFLFWTVPIFVALGGIATISTGLWCVVGRLIESSAEPDTGGEV
jgi:hypothetical protein